jgi:hypothetical protein
VLVLFGNFALDSERRELRVGGTIVPVEPQVFDVLVYLIANRDRVVSKDDLIASVWGSRIVSESTLTSRINAWRSPGLRRRHSAWDGVRSKWSRSAGSLEAQQGPPCRAKPPRRQSSFQQRARTCLAPLCQSLPASDIFLKDSPRDALRVDVVNFWLIQLSH